ncbi:hypothetical protein GCM10008927_11860 [Amylibacter ulvae]|uniref:Sulphotransferase Stf0 domain-containing protein n=1 Tax=Paramylibacter ulvae TaxID=1651968 RepID=A0ABQ3D2S5_9RHOB|nr:Stf0 family sulfotransferase [Amylibacter ulvae]GHA48413.1 hypothetical protein GCM10008927_11860 [Amylibacter ulvae]
MAKLTLLIATQRSGSTLLRSDIQDLGGMGVPGEHLMPLIRKDKKAFKQGGDLTVSEQDVIDLIAKKGGDDNSPDVYGLKLMVSYADHVNWMLGGEKETHPVQAAQNVIDWAYRTYDAVNLVSVVRPSILDQSISRAMAKTTGMYHMPQGDGAYDPYAQTEIDDDLLNFAIWREVPIVINHMRNLQSILDANQDKVLKIEFRELTKNQTESNLRIVEHARKFGFEPHKNLAERKLKKLIKKERSEQIKQNFFNFALNQGFGVENFEMIKSILK